MNSTKQATHNHKRAGAVRVLQSTTDLAKIHVVASGEEFWVKLSDLAELSGGVVPEIRPRKKAPREQSGNASESVPNISDNASPQSTPESQM